MSGLLPLDCEAPEVRRLAAARARLPLAAAAAGTCIARVGGQVAAIGCEGLVVAGSGSGRLPIRIGLMPRVRAHLAGWRYRGLAPWEHLVVDQVLASQAAGDGALYLLASGAAAREAVRSLWALGGARAVSGVAQHCFGLDDSWYAVRMCPDRVAACVAARSATQALLNKMRAGEPRAAEVR